MLRARRLQLLQSPLPAWRATTPATAALAAARAATPTARARHISSAITLRSNDHGRDHTSLALVVAQEARQEIVSEGREQTKHEASGERTGEQELVVRKIEGSEKMKQEVPRKIKRKRIVRSRDPQDPRQAAAMRARSLRAMFSKQQLSAEGDQKASYGEGGSVPAEGSKFRWVAQGPADEVPGRRRRAAASSPGASMAASSAAEPGTNPAPTQNRLSQLIAAGNMPPFPQRNYGQTDYFGAAALTTTTTTKSTFKSSGNPILRGGFLVGKGMSPLSQSHATPISEERRFRLTPTWKPYIKTKAPDQDSQAEVSERLSSEGTNQSSTPSDPPSEPPGDTPSDPSGEIDKPDEPAVPKPSIFDQLFNDKRAEPRPVLYEPISPVPEDEGDLNSRFWIGRDTPMKLPLVDDSIYSRLFPEEPQAKTEDSGPAQEQLAPLDTSDEALFVSLRNEVRNWIPKADREELNAPEPGEYGSQSTVVVISSVSSSLIDSDFYRIIPEGKYVEGWAGGLVKVLQARDPLSHKPVGQYFLMFHSRPSAVAYAEEVKRLHQLSQRLLHAPGSSGRKPARGKLESAPACPQPFLTEEEKAAARSFTLCSPDAKMCVSVRMWGLGMVGRIAGKVNVADMVQKLRPEAETPSKVLLIVGGYHAGLTPRELWLALRDDGLERGMPWVLKNAREGLMPVQTLSFTNQVDRRVVLRAEAVPVHVDVDAAEREGMLAEPGGAEGPGEQYLGGEGDQAGVGKADGSERFNRFVLTFPQPVDARRFVRSWHKRAIWDSELRRSVQIDAIAFV